MIRRWLALAVLGLAWAAPAAALEPSPAPLIPFVLPWDDASPGVTDASPLLDAPAGGLGPVEARDGHLFVGPKRIRFLGVNLAFGGNFPSREDAPRVAARLAKFGINCVRFHHMDMQSAPGGLFAADGRSLDPAQLDRLDFFVAELKKRGIYADLNLHVSRTYPGRPRWEGMPSYHKGVDNFDPAMIALQRDYARDLLGHVNPYTRSSYAAEPAVAIVEINNENALLHEWWTGALDDMPEPYAGELARGWNAWLSEKYPGPEPLENAWGARAEPPGREMLANNDFARGLSGWNLEQHEGARAEARVEPGDPGRVLRIAVQRPGKAGWHVQLAHPGLSVEADRPYTLTLRARADEPRRLSVNVMQAHDPWRQLWSSDLAVTPQWTEFRFVLAPAEADPNARITLTNLGEKAGAVELADVSLKPGGVLGLLPGEAPGRIEPFRKREFARRTAEAQRDWIRYLWDVEERYWTGLYRYLKDELKVRAPVLGTQMGWSPFPIQAKLDVVDSHAYWQHPQFPGRSWDPDHWSVRDVPMAGVKGGGTIPGLALAKVAGKPFLCTEYNHSAPNTYSSEAFLLLAAYAAMQDWDGIFAFAYSHRRDDWDEGKIPSFFDIDQHPTKMATLPAAAALFLRGDVAPPPGRVVARPTTEQVVEAIRRAGPSPRADAFGTPRELALSTPVGVALQGDEPDSGPPAEASREVSWRDGVVTVDAPRSKFVVGSIAAGPFVLGEVTIAPRPNRQDWAAISLTLVEGRDFRSPGRILVTATGYAENTDMGWKDAERSTVGRDWGRRPSLVEGLPATITLPVTPSRVRAWSLDEHGRRQAPASVRDSGRMAGVEIGPADRTIWYEIEVRP